MIWGHMKHCEGSMQINWNSGKSWFASNFRGKRHDHTKMKIEGYWTKLLVYISVRLPGYDTYNYYHFLIAYPVPSNNALYTVASFNFPKQGKSVSLLNGDGKKVLLG